ncbi:amidohydrolase family protein [Granulicella mallensis]|uniref:Amidohydrolase n=1 Tax=Granulicella mallensis (strain ATCC BAA-1857 / DSM 23137 / MP5ACTX8) TaxID=682795 RepID=G8NRX5_GRAMM|nr:amidohydrolase family protein [Granulicella mallensis]AEU35088.1 amidohydrolase [Granulicella mallensis MP5ACTX8]
MHRRLSLLSACFCLLFVPFATHAQKSPIALTGTLVMPQEVIPQGTVLIQNGRILASGADVKLPAGTKVVRTEGIIAPGLIDLHNHLTWNIFPRWKPVQEFGSRYDWQQKPAYSVLMAVPHNALVKQGLECEMERYAEVKAISEGETSVTGSLPSPCVRGLARNLDYDPELQGSFGKIIYNVFPFQMSEQELADVTAALSAQPRGALLIHVAEGAPNDASTAREFTLLKGRGLLRPGVSLIHGVALKPANFAEMAKQGVGFIWSPRSNIELYGDTANVAAARAAGVRMALAPDWSPTGSDGLLGELNYASVWNQGQSPSPFTERDLVLMATSNAAELAGLSGQIGSLAPGHAADLLVVRKEGQDAYWTLTHSTPQDLQLVLIGGDPLYGDPVLLQQVTGSHGERLEVCGTPKAVVVDGKPFAETEKTLDHALHQFGRHLAPLSECGN